MDQPTVKLLEVQSMGNDVLKISATIDGQNETYLEPEEYTEEGEFGGEVTKIRHIEKERPIVFFAQGWESATTNHFDVDEEGKRKEGAKPREMTEDEIESYFKRLILEQNPR